MKTYSAPQIPEDIVQSLQKLAASGASQDQMIRRMREAGLSIVPSITLLARLSGISVAQAKHAVHFSETWSDQRTANDAFHDTAFDAAELLSSAAADRDILHSR